MDLQCHNETGVYFELNKFTTLPFPNCVANFFLREQVLVACGALSRGSVRGVVGLGRGRCQRGILTELQTVVGLVGLVGLLAFEVLQADR